MSLSINSTAYKYFTDAFDDLIKSCIKDGIIVKSPSGVTYEDLKFHLTRTLYYDIYTDYKPYLKKELIKQWKNYENF